MSKQREALDQALRESSTNAYIYEQLMRDIATIKSAILVTTDGILSQHEDIFHCTQYINANKEAIDNLRNSNSIVSLSEYRKILSETTRSHAMLKQLRDGKNTMQLILNDRIKDLEKLEQTLDIFVKSLTANKVIDYANYAKARRKD
jgi:hypothetical protein